MKNSRILVVDDEPEVLGVIVDMLKEEGYFPRFTSDSREAERLLRTSKFDVIISDILMPYLNGFQLLRMARLQNPDVQVVLVTGYSSRELALEALKGGASCIIGKPFSNEQLAAAVHDAIGRTRLGKSDGTPAAGLD